MLGVPSLATIITRLIVLIVAFPAHEGAHALVADRLGDPTPRRFGRLTLNPLPHLDLVGSLLFLVFGFGWATTPVSPSYLGRTGMAIVSLAGPIANLLVALIFAIPARIVLDSPELARLFGSGLVFPSLGQIMQEMIRLNLLLFFFNLIPLPPLDGYKIVLGFLPYSLAQPFQQLERYGSLLLFVIIILAPGLISALIGPPLIFLARLLLGL